MTPTFSLVVNHTPWRPERVKALKEMTDELHVCINGMGGVSICNGSRPYADGPEWATLFHTTDYRGQDWQGGAKLDWQLTQWTWSRAQRTTHHVFLTDDLHLAPGFWKLLSAMVTAHPGSPIGLLSNHPRSIDLFTSGIHGYRTASWLVGPAYVIPHAMMAPFLAWFMAQPNERLRGSTSWNDDNAWNEFISTQWRGTTWHPLPTIVEHRGDLASTVGHGDRYSRERVSWREYRRTVRPGSGPVEPAAEGEPFVWLGMPWNQSPFNNLHGGVLGQMLEGGTKYWAGEAPLLSVGDP